MEPTAQPLSVSEFVLTLNQELKNFRQRIIGEVFSLKIADSGHVYFTLRDKNGDAVIDCKIWNNNYRIQGVRLKNGMEVIISGHPNVYQLNGRLSVLVESIELVGEGRLKAAYDELKGQLTREGLFAEESKREIPQFPQNVGIITSRGGAVIHDFYGNVGICGYRFIFCDSRVEGKDTLRDLLHSLKVMAMQDIEVLVVMRGGGPMQSLAAFDNEALVREIVAFPVPVIAAIGHHLDVPLAALAADVHVSTPTAAANLLGKSWVDGRYTFRKLTQEVTMHYSQVIQDTELTLQLRKETVSEAFQSLLQVFDQAKQVIKNHLTHIQAILPGLSNRVNNLQEYILAGFHSQITTQYKTLEFSDEILVFNETLATTAALLSSFWEESITRIYNFSFQTMQKELQHMEATIHLRDPHVLLKHGYSILRNQGKLVKSIENVTIGELLEVILADGLVITEVKKVKANE